MIAIVPIIAIYAFFSETMIKGMTAGPSGEPALDRGQRSAGGAVSSRGRMPYPKDAPAHSSALEIGSDRGGHNGRQAHQALRGRVCPRSST
jgi:hypothetical protein